MISTDPQIGCFKKLTLFCCYFCCWSTLGLFLLPQLYKENRMVGMSYAHWWVGLVSRVCGADPSFSSSVWNWCGSRYGISGVWVPPLWCSGYLVTSLQLTQGTGIRRANCHPAVTSPNSTPPPNTHTHLHLSQMVLGDFDVKHKLTVMARQFSYLVGLWSSGTRNTFYKARGEGSSEKKERTGWPFIL